MVVDNSGKEFQPICWGGNYSNSKTAYYFKESNLTKMREILKELNIEPIARMVSFAAVGVEPRIMGIGPVKAIPKALGISPEEFMKQATMKRAMNATMITKIALSTK